MIPHGAIVLYAAFLLLSLARIFMNRPGGAPTMASYFSGATASLFVTGLAAYGMVAVGADVFAGAVRQEGLALAALITLCVVTWAAMRRIWSWPLALEARPAHAGAPAAPRAGRPSPEPRTPRPADGAREAA